MSDAGLRPEVEVRGDGRSQAFGRAHSAPIAAVDVGDHVGGLCAAELCGPHLGATASGAVSRQVGDTVACWWAIAAACRRRLATSLAASR